MMKKVNKKFGVRKEIEINELVREDDIVSYQLDIIDDYLKILYKIKGSYNIYSKLTPDGKRLVEELIDNISGLRTFGTYDLYELIYKYTNFMKIIRNDFKPTLFYRKQVNSIKNEITEKISTIDSVLNKDSKRYGYGVNFIE